MPTYDHGVAGLTGTIGVTIRNADGTAHDARTTAGITEPVAGSGIYHIAHPHPGTLLLFIFDGGVGTVGGSCWDDGLTTMPARAGDAMTLATDALSAAALKADAVTAIATSVVAAIGAAGTWGLSALKALIDAVKAKTDTLDTATGTLTLSFQLLLDSDGDGVADVPNVGLSGALCHLFADTAKTTKIRGDETTDSLGWVHWHGLAAGTYTIDPDDPRYRAGDVTVTIPE